MRKSILKCQDPIGGIGLVVPSLRSIWVSVTHRSPKAQFWGKLRTAWNETGSKLKKTWILLWVSGVILLTFGEWGDSAGFWTNRPYLTNTFSALTSAAFGVPVALVVLQRIAASEADAGEARAARRMAARVSADLASAVMALAGDGIPAMRAALVYLREQRDSLVPNGDYWRPATAPRLYYQPFTDAIERAFERIEELFSAEIRRHLAEVSTQWSILTTESRSRLLATDNEWLTGLHAKELDALVRTVTGPRLKNWRRKGLELRDWYHREDQQPERGGRHYGEMDTLREFDSWFNEIITYIDAVIDLATKSALAAQALASP
jgi:hypothetical protein